MAPMMVNEAMPDATRILMTASGSGSGEAGSGTFASYQASIVPISLGFEKNFISIGFYLFCCWIKVKPSVGPARAKLVRLHHAR